MTHWGLKLPDAFNRFSISRLLVIAGPTGSGKTALSLELAKRAGAEIVCADSQQVYRGLDVGTAKPSKREREEIPHHLFDLVEPGERFDAARYAALADAALAGIFQRDRAAIVVGGTGLYLRALLRGVIAAPGRDDALRQRLEAEARELGKAHLHQRLASVDPESARRIRVNDLVRVVRALEIAAGGKQQSALHDEHRWAEPRYQHTLVVLEVSKEELHRRIDERANQMFGTESNPGGILSEARGLLERFGPEATHLLPKLPIGYPEAMAVLRGELSHVAAIERTQRATRRYAKRQLTWFRGDKNAQWIRMPCSPGTVDALAQNLSLR